MKRFIYLLIVCLTVHFAKAQNTFTLQDVIQRAQSQSPSFKIAETRKENRYWQYRYFKTNYIPQMRFISSSPLIYNNGFNRNTLDDGSIAYNRVQQFTPGGMIALEQPISVTGGTLRLNTRFDYTSTRQPRDTTYWNGAPVNIFLNQPLLAYNPLRWDRLIEPVKYEESKREYAESMEQIAMNASTFFFDVLQAQVNLQIAQFNLANNDTIYKIEQGRYNIGTTSQDKLLQVELQLLRSRQDVTMARLELKKTGLDLRTFIGLMSAEEFSLNLPDVIPQFVIDEAEAIAMAKETRSAFIAFQRRRNEARASLAQAKGQRYQVSLSASYGLNNTTQTMADLYNAPSRQQSVLLNFNVPIVDWGRRRALVKTAEANKKLTEYIIAQDEIIFEQEILTQVRQFETLWQTLEITKKSDEVALERYNVAQNRYLIGKTDITSLGIALREKDEAKRAYIQSLKLFWTSYYNLRKLTLYDFMERKYLYNPFAEDDNQ